ncbi:hypothetical protein [Herbaspirillum sp. ST 5-3]|uniref:hypothetical protein n=1 Tax=Oxalobacteraceae TaxID=75682 RepID=UPI0010A49C72|nr:hypothetical protein [Herbaspirillum sp. ST 5-3]
MKKITKKEQKRLDKEKRIEEARRQSQARLSYLNSLGLQKEEAITLTELKEIFTDGVIREHFPKPSYTRFNPHLTKSFQKANPKYMMKMYLMADVIEKIKLGVKARVKGSLNEEYKKLLLAHMLNEALSRKEQVKTITTRRKI